MFTQFYYPKVKGLGNVAVSRHAQERAAGDSISEVQFQDVLNNGKDTPAGFGATWREKDSVRLVIIVPTPFKGAKLVKTCFRAAPQAEAKI